MFFFVFRGILGAGLWVPSSVLVIMAIYRIGISVASGIWAGTTYEKLW